MKYKGKKTSLLYEKILVLPREDRIDLETGKPQEDIVLKFRPVSDWADFNKLCPDPKPPMVTFPGEEPRPCTRAEDEDYDNACHKHSQMQTRWMTLQSISATPDLEFETVDLQKPDTWINFETELMSGGFSIFEIQEIYKTATEANILTDEALKAAKDRFLASEQERLKTASSLRAVRHSTGSGEPASVSA